MSHLKGCTQYVEYLRRTGKRCQGLEGDLTKFTSFTFAKTPSCRIRRTSVIKRHITPRRSCRTVQVPSRHLHGSRARLQSLVQHKKSVEDPRPTQPARHSIWTTTRTISHRRGFLLGMETQPLGRVTDGKPSSTLRERSITRGTYAARGSKGTLPELQRKPALGSSQDGLEITTADTASLDSWDQTLLDKSYQTLLSTLKASSLR